ncbi:MAG: hypothetical protein QOH36_1395 [Actinomycetota bacterium]|nr:hypothetical protein [Actinomycetota bacterium]
MTVVPLPGVDAAQLLGALQQEATHIANLRSTVGAGVDRFNAYLRWSNDAFSRLRLMLPGRELDRLITTPRYWTLQAMDPSSRLQTLAGFVDLEITERLREFESESDRLSAEIARWNSRPGRLVIADTNVFLHSEEYFDELPWAQVVGGSMGVHLIIPMLIIDELDRAKRTQGGKKVSDSNHESVRTRARVTLRRIDQTLRPGRAAMLQQGAVSAEVLLDEPGRARLSDADDELVDQAVALHQLIGRDVYIVTSDVGMKYRAEGAGLHAVLRSEQIL